MNLPKINHSIYTHYLHGMDREVHFRPFTNAEQKILLVAKEEGKEDNVRILESVMQVLRNCIVDEDVNVAEMPVFDIEDIFMRIRAKSVGEQISIRYSYDYTDENGATKTDFVTVSINVDDIILDTENKKSPDIVVDSVNNLQVRLRYPSYQTIKEIANDNDDMKMICRCIEMVYNDEEVFDLAQSSDKEIEDFVDQFDAMTQLKVNEFFGNAPSLKYSVDVYMPKLDKTQTLTFRGLKDFFT